jgi:hypothetical protein
VAASLEAEPLYHAFMTACSPRIVATSSAASSEEVPAMVPRLLQLFCFGVGSLCSFASLVRLLDVGGDRQGGLFTCVVLFNSNLAMVRFDGPALLHCFSFCSIY